MSVKELLLKAAAHIESNGLVASEAAYYIRELIEEIEKGIQRNGTG